MNLFVQCVVLTGEIRSYMTHTYRVDGVPYRFTLDQTITYKECQAQPLSDLNTQRLVATRNFIIFNADEQVVRFAQTNRISTAIGRLYHS